MALLSSVDASTFAELSKRFHQKLKQQHALTVTLGQFRELMIQSVGHKSLHDARIAWARSNVEPPVSLSPEGFHQDHYPTPQAALDTSPTQQSTQTDKTPQNFSLNRPEQGNLLFWEEIGLPEPGTRDNPLPQAPTPESWREARAACSATGPTPLLSVQGSTSEIERTEARPPAHNKAVKTR